MSTVLESAVGETLDFAGLAPLLKEYRAHLEAALKAMSDYVESQNANGTPSDAWQRRWAIDRLRFQRLQSAVERFTRQVSQYVDHGQIDELTRVELELRLQDLEGLVSSARQAMSCLPS